MSAGFTKLERDVMGALVWELRHVAPDLAGQFGQSAPGARRNTGSGLFTQTLVNTRRPLSAERETGLFGTVHAMVGALPDPVAFQVELLNGRLVALHGDAYGQDTRAIDFAHVPFEQVFTVDASGQSIEFRPPAATPPGPSPAPSRSADPQSAPTAARPPVAPAPVPRPQPQPRPRQTPPSEEHPLAGRVGAAMSTLAAPELSPADDRVSILVGAWALIAVAAFLAVLVFRMPIIATLFVAGWLAFNVRRPKVLSALQRGLAAWKAAREQA